MEAKNLIDPDANHKRKLESRGLLCDDNRACKHAKLEPELSAPQNFVTCCHKWLFVEQDAFNLERSGTPVQFMFFNKGQWEDYRSDVTAAISICFTACESSTKFSVDGKMYLVDFVHMVQINLQTGYVRSVAWIDDRGKCFTPSSCIEGCSDKVLSGLQQTSEHRAQLSAGCSKCETVLNGLERKDVSTAAGPSLHDFAQLGSRLTTLADDAEAFAFVKNKFLSGLGLFARHTLVTGVYRCSFEGTSGQLRLQTFQRQEQAVREARGDANVHYAWHGTSKKGVSGIILHGFGQPRVPKHGAVYGVGVYLAPEEQSHVSASYSDVDENGTHHMLLCRVIMGRMERINGGSEQFYPSSEDYDTGVDDLKSPKRHIIWSTHMNTHILPEFVVSFKLAPSLHAAVINRQRSKHSFRLHMPTFSQPSLDAQGGKEAFLLTKAESVAVSPCSKQYRGSITRNVSTNVCDSIVEKPCASRRRGLMNKGTSMVVGTRKAPRSPWISFPDLFAMMEQKLDLRALVTLQQLYLEFKLGKLPRILLVKLMRVVAGDVILWECIRGNSMHAMPYFNAEAQSEDMDCHILPQNMKAHQRHGTLKQVDTL